MTCSPNTCGSIGVNTAMLVEESDLIDPCDPATFSGTSERYEILSENIRYTDNLIGGQGLTGTIDQVGAHLRHGARVVTGSLTMEVGPNELANWLPRIMGNSATSPYTTAETFDLLPFDIMLKRDQGTVTYRHCAVQSATFTSRASIAGEAQVVRMTISVIGYEEHDTTWPVSPPSLPTEDRLFWLIGDGKLELDTPSADTEYFFDAFSLRIDNGLTPRTRNFLQVTCLQSLGRKIRLRVSTPYTTVSHSNLYISDYSGEGTLSFLGSKNPETPSGYSTIFTMPDLHQTRITPATAGRGEIPLQLDFEAYRTGTDEPISVVNTIS